MESGKVRTREAGVFVDPLYMFARLGAAAEIQSPNPMQKRSEDCRAGNKTADGSRCE